MGGEGIGVQLSAARLLMIKEAVDKMAKWNFIFSPKAC